MKYLIILRKRPGGGYGVTIPDLPGCTATGATVDDAVANAQGEATRHVMNLVVSGASVPRPGDGEAPNFGVSLAATVEVKVDVESITLAG